MPSPTPNGLPQNRRFFGVILDVDTAAKLKELSAARGTTSSEIVRQAIAKALDETPQQEKVV